MQTEKKEEQFSPAEIDIIRQLVENRIFWKSEAPVVLLVGTNKKATKYKALESLKRKKLIRTTFFLLDEDTFSLTSLKVRLAERIKNFIGLPWNQYESRDGAEKILTERLKSFIL